MKARTALFSILFVALVFALVTPVALAQDGTNTVPAQLPDLGGRVVKAVSSNDYVPFSFVDTASGKNVGLEYELLDEICRRLNCVLEHGQISWDGLLAAVNSGEFDLGHIGITIKDERKELVDFSEPFVVVEQKMMVRMDEDRFADSKSFVEMTDLKFGAQPGTTSYYTAAYLVGEGNEASRIVAYESFALAVQGLINGDVDAVVTDAVSGAGFIGANAGKLKLQEEILSPDPLGFVFPKGSDLVEPFNAAMASMVYDGYMSYLQNKWFFIFQP